MELDKELLSFIFLPKKSADAYRNICETCGECYSHYNVRIGLKTVISVTKKRSGRPTAVEENCGKKKMENDGK